MFSSIVSLLPDTSLWWVVIVSSIFIGFAKTSFSAIFTIAVPIMALAFGAKESTGFILPILCLADIGSIIYYRRSCSWKHLWKLLIWAIVGLFVGIAIDYFVPTSAFKLLLAFSIFIGVIVILYNQFKGATTPSKSRFILPFYGVLGGFATMIGNAAGPIMSVYLLTINMPKMLFVGTSAWFFMAINYIKLPLQIWVWDNIHLQNIYIALVMIPFILLGSVLGIFLVKVVPETVFRKLVIWITLASALVLLF